MYFFSDFSCALVSADAATSSTCRSVEIGADLRDADAVEQQRPLALHVLDGVGGERLQLGGHPGLRLDHQIGDRFRGLLGAGGDRLLAEVHRAAVEPDLGAVLEPGEDLLADAVDQDDVRS